MRREREIKNSTNPLLSLVPTSPDKPQDEVKNINEARPPGVQEVIQAARIEPSTPDGIRRRLSRDKILSQRKQQEFRQKFSGTKIYDAKDFIMSDSPPKESIDPTHTTPRSSSPIARHIKFTTSMGEIPTMCSDPMLPSPTVITTTSEGKADVAAVESGTEHPPPSTKQIKY